MKTLLTGFEPFGGLPFNPSQLVVESLSAETIPVRYFTQILPVSYRSAFEILKNKFDQTNPDLVLMLGVAGKAETPRIETRADNLIKSELKDNEGYLPEDKNIIDKGPAYLITPLNIEAILKNIREQKFEITLSKDCGSYLCNYVYYRMLHYINLNNLPAAALFVHIPNIKAEKHSPEFISSLNDFTKLTKTILETIVTSL